MEYKVLPFVASINIHEQGSEAIAKQLDQLIKNQSEQGWKYLRLESVSTYIQPVEGCFGNTEKQGYMTSYQMAVFIKPDDEILVDHHH